MCSACDLLEKMQTSYLRSLLKAVQSIIYICIYILLFELQQIIQSHIKAGSNIAKLPTNANQNMFISRIKQEE